MLLVEQRTRAMYCQYLSDSTLKSQRSLVSCRIRSEVPSYFFMVNICNRLWRREVKILLYYSTNRAPGLSDFPYTGVPMKVGPEGSMYSSSPNNHINANPVKALTLKGRWKHCHHFRGPSEVASWTPCWGSLRDDSIKKRQKRKSSRFGL